MRYLFISNHAKQYPVSVMCHLLEVIRSGYYVWLCNKITTREKDDSLLSNEIEVIYKGSKDTYGSPRVYAALRQQGRVCGRHRVARIMRLGKMISKHHRKRQCTTDSNHNYPVAMNILDRQFSPTALNQVWVNDITYIPTGEGWLYLAAVMDLASRRIVGWSMSSRIDKLLVSDALVTALNNRNPTAGLIHHSDRGSQYASNDYQTLLAQHGIIPSMSRKGNCWDNAPMESFFHSMKVEWLHDLNFRTRADARQTIFAYIEIWYNRQRLHSTLGYRSPEAYEKQIVS